MPIYRPKSFAIGERKLKPLTLIPRDGWGAVPPVSKTDNDTLQTIMHPVPRVIIAYTEDELCLTPEECVKRVQEMQRRDMEEGLVDIRYNFIVGGDGNVYEGRGWLNRPAESPSLPEWYGESYEIAHIGLHGKQVPNFMAKAAWDMIQVGIGNNYVTDDYDMYFDIFKACAEGHF